MTSATVPPALPPAVPPAVPPSGTVVLVHAHPDDEAIFTGVAARALAEAGLRVVLVVATDGCEGVPRFPLDGGESLRDRRRRELERAAALLGVSRLEVLPYADSGAHAGPYRPGTLGAAPAGEVAGRLRAIAESESAAALVHYDARGIYGHVDHVQVYRAGALVAAALGIPGYEATVDPDALRRGPRHVLADAAGDALDVGTPVGDISFAVRADDRLLDVKMAAMAAHASQIGPRQLAGAAEGYRREWFVRRGPAGPLDAALAPLTVPVRPGRRGPDVPGPGPAAAARVGGPRAIMAS